LTFDDSDLFTLEISDLKVKRYVY